MLLLGNITGDYLPNSAFFLFHEKTNIRNRRNQQRRVAFNFHGSVFCGGYGTNQENKRKIGKRDRLKAQTKTKV
jgi:hypothetical protein